MRIEKQLSRKCSELKWANGFVLAKTMKKQKKTEDLVNILLRFSRQKPFQTVHMFAFILRSRCSSSVDELEKLIEFHEYANQRNCEVKKKHTHTHS